MLTFSTSLLIIRAQIDLDTLSALESYLAEYNGVLVIVSHDRFFTDKVTDHLFIFEGQGIVKDYVGSLSDYAEALTEQESTAEASSSVSLAAQAKKQVSYKEDKEKRVERRNAIRKIKREMNNLEPTIDNLKANASEIQTEIDNSDSNEGWSVLAELTEKMTKLTEEAEKKEERWLELAEELEKWEAKEAES